MESFVSSKWARLFAGASLLCLAYTPVAIDFFNMTDEDIVASNSDFDEISIKPFTPNIERSSLMSHWIGSDPLSPSFSDTKDLSPNAASNFFSDFQSRVANLDSSQEKLRENAIKTISSGAFKGSKFVQGVIKSNFYVDAKKYGVPVAVIDGVIRGLSRKIDFRRSLKKDDKFEIAFNDKKEILYFRITTKRQNVAMYKFGKEGHFFENGEKVSSLKKSNAFGLPLRGAYRISSRYGYRRHPITGRYKHHAGVDFAARYGTPIYAIFDGVVTRAANYSGYGKCVDIKHASGYSSRYGHLSRIFVSPGTWVKKGQRIGSVGSSGFSTGSHLHLELAKNSKTMNPLSVKMMPEKVERVSNNRKFNALKKYSSKLALFVS